MTRLLSKQEVKNKKREQINRDAVFALRAKKLITDENKKLNEFKARKAEEFEMVNEEFGKFINENTHKRNKLVEEINQLRAERHELLKPVEKNIEFAEQKLKEALLKKVEYDQLVKDQKIIELKLHDREIKLAKKENKLEASQKNATNEQKYLNDDKETFLAQKKEFEMIREEHIRTHGRYMDEITVQKLELEKREASVAAQAKINEQEREKMSQEWRKINDQRATLERALKRKKQYGRSKKR